MPARERASHKHAFRTLRNLQIDVREVVAVHPEAILYVSVTGRARTAWLVYRDGKLTARDEPGFPIEPSKPL